MMERKTSFNYLISTIGIGIVAVDAVVSNGLIDVDPWGFLFFAAFFF